MYPWADTIGRPLANNEKGFGILEHASKDRLSTEITPTNASPRNLRLHPGAVPVRSRLDLGNLNLISSMTSPWTWEWPLFRPTRY